MTTTKDTNPETVTTTYNQPTAKPTAKVAAVGVTGTVVTIITFLALNVFGVQIPEDMLKPAVTGVVAIVSLVTFLAGYFKKSNTK